MAQRSSYRPLRDKASGLLLLALLAVLAIGVAAYLVSKYNSEGSLQRSSERMPIESGVESEGPASNLR